MENVKVESPKAAPPAAGLPLHARLANVLAAVVAGVCCLAVSAVLADGTSVIKLKHAQFLPIATADDPDLVAAGIHHRLDELLGPTYGVGLHHDQAGHTWTEMAAGSTLKDLLAELGTPATGAALPYVISTDDLKHPVPFLSCDTLQTAGLAAVSLGFIAEVVCALMLIFHSLVLAGLVPSNVGKPLASLIWFVLSMGFMVVVLLAISVYYGTWTCDNPVIPSLKISDHFDYNYGFSFAVIGFLSSLLVLVVTLCMWPMNDAAPAPNCAAGKIFGGVSLGLVVGAVLIMLALTSNGAFEPEAAADPAVNPCEGKRPRHAGPGDSYFSNTDCLRAGAIQVLEQAGANVTRGYRGQLDAGNRIPITSPYADAGLCPVNVHWHLGAEHLSAGQFDAAGHGPSGTGSHRMLAGDSSSVRQGFQCHHYDSHDAKFTTEYNWQHCTHMHVGETYEIHWPHSAAGACGTPWQMQTPFYDGVFCHDGIISLAPLNTYQKIGVQAQVFTIVNDEEYYNGNLINGMIVGGDFGTDMAAYTGSTTGTTRNNEVCSRFTPITWQVDRKCHMISASSFDKLCQDMLAVQDDMSGDVHPHGSRELVDSRFVADNHRAAEHGGRR